jgi:hypothetical protein
MRKAFKVATVFTGAAACTALFAPGAEAATATAAKPQLIVPDTTHKNCAIGPRTTSTVFYWPAAKNHGPTCVGGGGNYGISTSLGGNVFTSYCPGNNFGIFTTTDGGIRSYSPGTEKIHLGVGVKEVSISFWEGGDKCAT